MAAERLVVLNPDDELYPRMPGARRAPAARNARPAPKKTQSKPRAAAKPRTRSTRNSTTGSTTMATAAKKKPAKKATVKARKTATPNPDAKRKAAARKAAATRRKNAEVRSAAAKKAARTRKRNASRPATAKSPARKPAARRPNPALPVKASKKAPTRSAKKAPGGRSLYRNPATFAGFVDSLKSAAQVGAVLLPVRAVINYIGAWPTAKDAAGLPTQTVSQKVGPLFDVGLSALSLWAVPRFLLKGNMAKYRQTTIAALNANLILSGIKTLAWYARRGWSAENAAIPAGDAAYPRWTDYIEFAEPQARSLSGAGGRVAGHRVAGRYQTSVGPRAGAGQTLVFNRATGAYQPAARR